VPQARKNYGRPFQKLQTERVQICLLNFLLFGPITSNLSSAGNKFFST